MEQETQVVEGQEQEAPQLTEIEQRALEMGWRPQSEFNGDAVDFIDAKEFVNRKPLFDRIESQSKQLKNVSKALDALKQHYTKVQETEFNRALSTLKAERRSALQDGDGEKFDKLDDEIKDVEKQLVDVKANANVPAVQEETQHPEFVAWAAKNQWYSSTGYMRSFADEFGNRLAQQGVSPSDVLKQVEQAVRKEFPQKFTNPNKQDAPDVGSSRQGSASRGSSMELSDQERRIMNTLVQGGHITKEKYLADLKAAKDLK